jgi:hypothetical protein
MERSELSCCFTNALHRRKSGGDQRASGWKCHFIRQILRAEVPMRVNGNSKVCNENFAKD